MAPLRGDVEEKERFWNHFDRLTDRVGNGYRLFAVGDLNGCVGDRMRASITGEFGVMGENDK